MSPPKYPTCPPKTDHVRVFQASWVVEVYWKIQPLPFSGAKQANFKVTGKKVKK